MLSEELNTGCRKGAPKLAVLLNKAMQLQVSLASNYSHAKISASHSLCMKLNNTQRAGLFTQSQEPFVKHIKGSCLRAPSKAPTETYDVARNIHEIWANKENQALVLEKVILTQQNKQIQYQQTVATVGFSGQRAEIGFYNTAPLCQ